MLDGGEWSAEVDKSFLIDDPLTLRIVELNYNPAGTAAEEFLETFVPDGPCCLLLDLQLPEVTGIERAGAAG